MTVLVNQDTILNFYRFFNNKFRSLLNFKPQKKLLACLIDRSDENLNLKEVSRYNPTLNLQERSLLHRQFFSK